MERIEMEAIYQNSDLKTSHSNQDQATFESGGGTLLVIRYVMPQAFQERWSPYLPRHIYRKTLQIRF